ncbi:hypothetical protein BYT27DRAFT_7254539 [Phlegmacium glaucopus]|nr:hypothetical protein BYT27DRAFT_7254539 [Phlegmacium glaucopus]
MAQTPNQNPPSLLNQLCSILQDPDMPILLQHLTSDQSRSIGNRGHLSDSSSFTKPSNSPPEDERIKLISELESSVKHFRTGLISKTEAISSVLQILRENPHVSGNESQKEKMFESYLAEILSLQQFVNEAARSDTHQVQPDQPVNSPKRKERRGDKSLDHEDDESGGEGDPPSKRQKLLESDMPWFNSINDPSPNFIHPVAKKPVGYYEPITQTSLEPNSLPKSPQTHPPEFLHHSGSESSGEMHFDEERKGCVGDAEISFGAPEAKKHVRSASEWTSAWRRASKAKVTFPHRRNELLNYGDYIEEEFAAKLPSSHHRIIL